MGRPLLLLLGRVEGVLDLFELAEVRLRNRQLTLLMKPDFFFGVDPEVGVLAGVLATLSVAVDDLTGVAGAGVVAGAAAGMSFTTGAGATSLGAGAGAVVSVVAGTADVVTPVAAASVDPDRAGFVSAFSFSAAGSTPGAESMGLVPAVSELRDGPFNVRSFDGSFGATGVMTGAGMC